MVHVTGPMTMTVSQDDRKCSVCDKSLKVGDDLFIGRANGQHIRACSMQCFKKFCKSLKTDE